MIMWDLVLYPTASLVVGLISVYLFFPHILVRLGLRLYQYLSHMEIKYVGEDGFIFCYAERGQPIPGKSSILFIHGFTSSKDQFMPLFKKLPHDIHLVALDLPGHGGTNTPSRNEEIGFELFLDRIHKFVELIGLDKAPFHLIGASLGGAMAGVYASRYPEQIERLTLMCPAMKTPVETDFFKQVDKAIEKGDEFTVYDCSLLPQDADAFQTMLNLCMYNKTKIDKQILKGIVDLRKPQNEFFLTVFKKLSSADNKKLLEEVMNKLMMPTHLLWGKHDELVHISGVELLKTSLPNCCQVDVLEHCGHNIELDRPGAVVKALLQFRRELKTKSSTSSQ